MNVWVALTCAGHIHSASAWLWFRSVRDDTVLFCRFTQLGLLRLVTTTAVMGDDCLTIKKAWAAYDQWLADVTIDFAREPAELDDLFRRATTAFSSRSAPKALGDCYLLALSQALNATLVTLDSGLADLGSRVGQAVTLL